MSCMYNLNNTSFVQSKWILFPETFQRKIIFTVHIEVAKVMFLHLSVCPRGGSASVHAEIPPPHPGSRHTSPLSRPPLEWTPPGADPPSADGYCCGRCASYWKAFLFWIKINLTWTHCIRLHRDFTLYFTSILVLPGENENEASLQTIFQKIIDSTYDSRNNTGNYIPTTVGCRGCTLAISVLWCLPRHWPFVSVLWTK